MSSSKSHTLKRLSCDRCHSQKLRCPRSGDDAACGRCQRQGVTCTFSPPLPRGRPRTGPSSSSRDKETKATATTMELERNTQIQAPINTLPPEMGYWNWLPNDFLQQDINMQLTSSTNESIIHSVTPGLGSDPLQTAPSSLPRSSPLSFSPFSVDSTSAPVSLPLPMLVSTGHEDKERCVAELSTLMSRLYSVSHNCRILAANTAREPNEYITLSLDAIFSTVRDPTLDSFNLTGPAQSVRDAYETAQSFLILVSARTRMAANDAMSPVTALGDSISSEKFEQASTTRSSENVLVQEGAVFHLVIACYSLLLQTFGVLAAALDRYATTDSAGQPSLTKLRLVLLKDTIYFFFKQLETTMVAYALALDALAGTAKNARPETHIGHTQGYHAQLESVAKSESRIVHILEQLYQRLAQAEEV